MKLGDQQNEDILRARRCLQGDASTLEELRSRMDGSLRGILRSRGATETEAEDVLADLWGDCVGEGEDHPALLEKYSGKCPLQAWLALVATNRWYDAKRRGARMQPFSEPGSRDDTAPTSLEHIKGEQNEAGSEEAIVELLRDSLRTAFTQCAPRDLVLLRLVFMHGLSQREVARALHWNESKVSRVLSHAMEGIASRALGAVKARDPWLDLSWEDFVELCQTRQIGFL